MLHRSDLYIASDFESYLRFFNKLFADLWSIFGSKLKDMEATKRTKKQKVRNHRKESDKLLILREWEECGFKTNLIASKHNLSGQTLRNWYAQHNTNEGLLLTPSPEVAQKQLDSQIKAEAIQIDLVAAKDQLAIEGAKEMIRRMANGIVLHTIKDKDIISLIKLSSSEVAGGRGTSIMDALELSIQKMRQSEKEGR